MQIEDLTIELFQQRFVIGLLFFVRVTALLATGPFFNNTAIPSRIKVALAGVIALLLTTAFGGQQPPITLEAFAVVPLVFKEAFIGVLLGFSSNMLFYAVRLAGGLADFDMGFQTSLLFNVDAGAPTLVGELQSLATMMIFLILNGHHFLLEALVASVKAVPLTTFVLSQVTINALVELVTVMFVLGVKIAAPVLVSLFIANLSLALLARAAPQINIFVLSFQVKIIVGLLVLFLSVPLFVIVVKGALGVVETQLMEIIQGIQGARGR